MLANLCNPTIGGSKSVASNIPLHHFNPQGTDNGRGVSCPDGPGVTVVADTLDDALGEAGIALGFAFEDWQGNIPPRGRSMNCAAIRIFSTGHPMR